MLNHGILPHVAPYTFSQGCPFGRIAHSFRCHSTPGSKFNALKAPLGLADPQRWFERYYSPFNSNSHRVKKSQISLRLLTLRGVSLQKSGERLMLSTHLTACFIVHLIQFFWRRSTLSLPSNLIKHKSKGITRLIYYSARWITQQARFNTYTNRGKS